MHTAKEVRILQAIIVQNQKSDKQGERAINNMIHEKEQNKLKMRNKTQLAFYSSILSEDPAE